ncbi:MAG: hypothetical protein H0X45_03515 [Planctomycetes bacterium]|nr:hypothetical protein [Planctomycetota bacterium]
MGFFDFLKGKKKDKAEDLATGQVKRPSRRIIAPEGKSTGTGSATKPAAAPVKPATQRVTNTTSAPAKPGTSTVASAGKPAQSGPRPVLPPPSPSGKPSGPKPTAGAKPTSGPMKASPKSDDGGLMIGASKPSGPSPVIGGTTTRAKGKDPISAPKPLEFAGDLASGSRGGPARTGEQALIDFLINKARLLDAAQADKVRDKAEGDGIAIDAAAVQLGFLTEDKLVTALTQECWVPHLKVDKYEIRKKALDTISREDAEHYGVFPVDKLGSLLTLAMVNPLDTETIRVLESKTGLDIKKVVATRAEITQGIEKYYSGQVQAKEGSLGFVQDVEAKSVTQMISNVQGAAKTPTSVPPPKPKPAPAPAHVDVDNIVPEIEDIDELLSSDEVIAPAIIEPVSIKADEPAVIGFDELEPIAPGGAAQDKTVESERIGIDELDEIAISGPPAKTPAAAKQNDGLIDLDVDISLPEPELFKTPSAGSTIKTPLPAHEAVPQTGALERNPVKTPAPVVAPVAKAPVAPAAKAPIAPAAKAPVAPIAPAAAPVAPAKSAKRDSPSKRHSRTADMINLIPVMEEEFQHAITHGRSHLFEKWVGLQTRNRIINGIAIEDDVAEVMSSLFANGRRI